MKRYMIIGLVLIAASSTSCKSYCGRSCVNKYSSVTPKEDTNTLDVTKNTDDTTVLNY